MLKNTAVVSEKNQTQFHGNEFENHDELVNILEKYTIPKLIQEEENLTRIATTDKTEEVPESNIKFTFLKVPGPVSLSNCFKLLRRKHVQNCSRRQHDTGVLNHVTKLA